MLFTTCRSLGLRAWILMRLESRQGFRVLSVKGLTRLHSAILQRCCGSCCGRGIQVVLASKGHKDGQVPGRAPARHIRPQASRLVILLLGCILPLCKSVLLAPHRHCMVQLGRCIWRSCCWPALCSAAGEGSQLVHA